MGSRACHNRSLLPIGVSSRARWQPVFFDPDTGTEVAQPKTFVLDEVYPKCDGENEVMHAVYHHEHTYDDLMLLSNGSLSHRLVHDKDDTSSRKMLYPPGKYCVDDMVIREENNKTSVVEFAFICVDNRVDVKALIDDYVYPIGLSVSMLCLLATFMLYSFLPQLRDLTGLHFC